MHYSRGLLAYATAQGATALAVGDFAAVPGQGVTCTVHGRALAVGALPWLISRGCAPPADAARRAFEDLEHEGKTVVGVARDATLLAVAAMADTLKPDAARVVRELETILIPHLPA